MGVFIKAGITELRAGTVARWGVGNEACRNKDFLDLFCGGVDCAKRVEMEEIAGCEVTHGVFSLVVTYSTKLTYSVKKSDVVAAAAFDKGELGTVSLVAQT